MDFQDGISSYNICSWLPEGEKDIYMLSFSRGGAHFYCNIKAADLQKLIEHLQAVARGEVK